MEAKAQHFLRPALMLALVAVFVPIALAAASFSAPRIQVTQAPPPARADLAALDLMLFVHRADLISASRPASLPRPEIRK